MSNEAARRSQAHDTGSSANGKHGAASPQPLHQRINERIGEGLVRIGVMTPEQVDTVISRQRAGDGRMFGRIAIELGYANEEAILGYIRIGGDTDAAGAEPS